MYQTVTWITCVFMLHRTRVYYLHLPIIIGVYEIFDARDRAGSVSAMRPRDVPYDIHRANDGAMNRSTAYGTTNTT